MKFIIVTSVEHTLLYLQKPISLPICQSLTSIMQPQEERANESEAETVVDFSLTDVLEDEKLKEDYRSQWNVWRSQVSLLILIRTHERQSFMY